MGPSPHLWFLDAKQRILVQSTSLYGYQTSLVVLCMQKSVICTRIKTLYGLQLSPVVLCMQSSDLWTRKTRLNGSQTWPFVLHMYDNVISTRITRLYGSQPSSVGFACKTTTFGPVYESLWVPDLTCRFVRAKERDLHKNKNTIWVAALTCGFVHAKQRL